MNRPILNRDFSHPADGWYQIEAKGEHPNRAAGLIQVIDDEAGNSIVDRFNQDAAAGKLRHGKEMLIDHEHFSDQPDKETRAYGWLQELQNRADGIYGRIRWSKTGRAGCSRARPISCCACCPGIATRSLPSPTRRSAS